MGLKASDLLGTSQVGVHLAMVGRVLFAPLQLSKKDVRGLEDCLGLEVAQISVGGSTLVGALIAPGAPRCEHLCGDIGAALRDGDPEVLVLDGVHLVELTSVNGVDDGARVLERDALTRAVGAAGPGFAIAGCLTQYSALVL